MKNIFTVLVFALISSVSNAQSGNLDSTFGTNGKVVGFGFGECFASAIQQDGKIIAAGRSDLNGGRDNFLIVRYLSNGELDSSFGSNGKVVTGFVDANKGDYDYEAVYSISIQSDGRIIVAGDGYIGYPDVNYNILLARYTKDGRLDSSFGINGKVSHDFGGNEYASSMIMQPDGKLIVTGEMGNSILVARYMSDGNLDESFGNNGIVISNFGGIGISRSVALQSDGKIVIAGGTNVGSGEKFLVVRYLSDGNLDVTFGVGGSVITDFGKNDEQLNK